MKVLIVVCAAIACALANPANYAYSAYAPLGYAYNQLAYSAVPYAYAAPVAAPAVAVGVKSQYYSDAAGQISYGFSEPSQSQNVVQDAAGNKVGSFSYINPNGKLVRTDFVADALGYRVASNDLLAAPLVQPLPPADTPEVSAAKAKFFAEFAAAKSRSRRSLVQTPASTSPLAVAAPVAYSAAPASFAYSTVSAPVAYSAVSAPVAYSAVNAPIAYSAPFAYGYPYAYASPIVKPNGYLADTPEVSAAKANFFAEYAAVKSRSRRSLVQTPASTSLLAAPVAYPAPVAYSAVPAPVAYSAVQAPVAYSAVQAPVAYSAVQAPIAYSAYSPYSFLSSFSSIGSPISQTFKK